MNHQQLIPPAPIKIGEFDELLATWSPTTKRLLFHDVDATDSPPVMIRCGVTSEDHARAICVGVFGVCAGDGADDGESREARAAR